MRLLIIEDEKALANIIVDRFNSEGYFVDVAYDGEEGLHYTRMANYDAIILDIMLPKIDGISLLKTIRSEKNYSPVLLLTAKGSIGDKIIGLDLGADDYMAKPFSMDELLARVRAIIRRNSEEKNTVLVEGDLQIDTVKKIVFRGNIEIPMTSKEYTILEFLCRNRGQILSREQIIEHCWNFDFNCDINIVNVYIRYLRSKIDDSYDIKLIHSIRGRGYMLKWKD